MTKLHDARAIANSLIERGKRDGKSFDPLQLAKLVYFCHAWMLGLYGRELIKQDVRAWLYGPVVPPLYRSLKKFGRETVTEPISGFSAAELDDKERNIFDQVYEKYSNLTGVQLSHITHETGTPWDSVWSEKGRDSVISNNLIKEYYEHLYREREQQASS